MAWRDNLQQASFRGISFKVERVTTEVGRRTEIHNYPVAISGRGKEKEDYVWAKDLGAEADTFTIDAYVIQNSSNDFDYFQERDNLISACKTQGPGILVHPFFEDELNVSINGRVRVDENFTSEGGIARFSIPFVQYKKPLFTQLDEDFLETIDNAVADMRVNVTNSFAEIFDTTKAFIGSSITAFKNNLARVRGIISEIQGALSDTIATSLAILSEINNTVEAVILSPCKASSAMKAGADSFLRITGMSGEIIQSAIAGPCGTSTPEALVTLTGELIPESLGISIIRAICNNTNFSFTEETDGIPSGQVRNVQILTAMNQSFLLGNACRIAIRTEYFSQQQMKEIKEFVVEAIDDFLERVGDLETSLDDDIFRSIYEIKANFIDAMENKFVTLVRECEYNINTEVMSTLELSYNLYDDITREEEIFNRNKTSVKHPGFLPNGESLQVLSE